jgi:hypothetical protein
VDRYQSFGETLCHLAILGKEKPNIENIRDLNLAVVRHMIVQVIKLVLQPEQTFIGHNLL